MPYRVRSTDVWFNLPGVVAAYQPVAAPDPFAARQNVSHDARRPGVYRANPGAAPTWASSTGWTFAAASSQYLMTGIVPGSMYTMVVRMSDGTSDQWQALAGCHTDRFLNSFCLYRAYGESHAYIYGSAENIVGDGQMIAGVYALVGGVNGYKDGVVDAALAGTWSGTPTRDIYIGAWNANGSASDFSSCKVQSAMICSRGLSAADVWQVSRQMAYCHVNPEWSAWGRRRRYFYAPEQAAVVRWRGIGRNDTPVSGRISTGRPI